MPNSEFETLQDILSHMKYSTIYNTSIEVSPLLYNYLKNKYETAIEICQLKDAFPYPQTLYGYPIEINIYLKGLDYTIVRKENRYE